MPKLIVNTLVSVTSETVLADVSEHNCAPPVIEEAVDWNVINLGWKVDGSMVLSNVKRKVRGTLKLIL